eukprot:TRINITY_DN4142_c0_g1_i1.p1 TRINITY_DN4142_c0_g1~~TRINITY_DN4142_c0_g1_i1.p1  ORF type:complete len:478 (+),score=76.40 TRINITY_DN4142_c0_g1_i1:258-1691(+)
MAAIAKLPFLVSEAQSSFLKCWYSPGVHDKISVSAAVPQKSRHTVASLLVGTGISSKSLLQGKVLDTGRYGWPSVRFTRSVVRMSALLSHTDSFQNVSSMEDILAGIQKEIDAKRLPARAGPAMGLFFDSYRQAILRSGVEDAEAVAVRVMATVFDRIMVQFEDPFTFPSHHLRITEPYDYYNFGQNYVRPLIDFKTSYLGNEAMFDTIDQQLTDGHNVVLLSNHQTEADPAVLALLLEKSHPRLATELTYIAGDRVVLDPFCKPFSMGRNLLCVFSKKRMNDVPELTEKKMAQNRRTLKEMAMLFKKGGNLIWIAPSGGRDRPDPVTGEWVPAPFDPATVELMRRLLEDASPPGHLIPTALLCYDIMPPPRTVEKALGEQRIIGFHGTALSVAPELDFHAVAGHVEAKKEAREILASAAFTAVCDHYAILKQAVHGGRGAAAASTLPGGVLTLTQPWLPTAVSSNNGASAELVTSL